jgi:sugar diacid utilization regulator
MVWGWLGGPSRPSDSDLDELVAWQRRRQGQVAFGEPAGGIAGFSVSHHQALEASDVAIASRERVVRFADLRLSIALLRDRNLAHGFVERELGELAGPIERLCELRATVRAYLENGQCVSTTASLLRRDRKTIQRQLQAAEQILGRCVRDRSGELLIALRTAEILGRRD